MIQYDPNKCHSKGVENPHAATLSNPRTTRGVAEWFSKANILSEISQKEIDQPTNAVQRSFANLVWWLKPSILLDAQPRIISSLSLNFGLFFQNFIHGATFHCSIPCYWFVCAVFKA